MNKYDDGTEFTQHKTDSNRVAKGKTCPRSVAPFCVTLARVYHYWIA